MRGSAFAHAQCLAMIDSVHVDDKHDLHTPQLDCRSIQVLYHHIEVLSLALVDGTGSIENTHITVIIIVLWLVPIKYCGIA